MALLSSCNTLTCLTKAPFRVNGEVPKTSLTFEVSKPILRSRIFFLKYRHIPQLCVIYMVTTFTFLEAKTEFQCIYDHADGCTQPKMKIPVLTHKTLALEV
jgi:hypothetical protein